MSASERYSSITWIFPCFCDVFLRTLTLITADRKIIVLIPKLITKADKNPKKYIPIESEKIKILTVPGHGIIPAEIMSAISVEFLSTLQEPQPQLEV